mmetsp:Transcript_12782/g.24973  ORF Transcript_12782/g.24973 Transcript_12782/m.24973 type:complete len:487 (+) Transcript_12782:38-1498(+)
MSGFDHAGIEGFLSLFSAGLGLWSYRKELQHHQQNLQMAKRQHDEIKELERRMHKETKAMNKKAIRNDKKLATAAKKLDHLLHHRQLCASLEQHLQDISGSLITAGREADRDMWDQRNAQFQTLLLAATVMFGAGIAVIVEGQLPENTSEATIIGFSVSIGFSFAALFVSIILCFRIVLAMSRFMYQLTNYHQSVVTALVMKSIEVMDRLVQIQNEHEIPDDVDRSTSGLRERDRRGSLFKRQRYRNLVSELTAKRRDINKYLAGAYLNRRYIGKKNTMRASDHVRGSSDHGQLPGTFHRASSRMGAKDRESAARESAARGSTARGSTARGSTADAKVHPSNLPRGYSSRETPRGSNLEYLEGFEAEPFMTEFEAFWKKKLRMAAMASMALFYAGTSALLVAILFLSFSRFTITSASPVAAYLFMTFILTSLVAGAIIAITKVGYQDYHPQGFELHRDFSGLVGGRKLHRHETGLSDLESVPGAIV